LTAAQARSTDVPSQVSCCVQVSARW
jgi:hypothetical protein